MVQLAVIDDFFDLRWEQVLSLLFSEADHLVSEDAAHHLDLVLIVGGVFRDLAKCLNQVL